MFIVVVLPSQKDSTISQYSPDLPSGQMHLKSFSNVSLHVAPSTHGFDSHLLICLVQSSPMKQKTIIIFLFFSIFICPFFFTCKSRLAFANNSLSNRRKAAVCAVSALLSALSALYFAVWTHCALFTRAFVVVYQVVTSFSIKKKY